MLTNTMCTQAGNSRFLKFCLTHYSRVLLKLFYPFTTRGLSAEEIRGKKSRDGRQTKMTCTRQLSEQYW